MGQISATRTTTGKSALTAINYRHDGVCRFQAVLRADVGAIASVNCRPIAAESGEHTGFPVGGEVTISGTADANGLVGADGFPFWSTFPLYGIEVVSISGTGASVTAKVGC